MRQNPYSTSEFFDVICKRIELPDILDYHLSDRFNSKSILYYEWDFISRLNFGGNEGIYLSIYMDEGNHFLDTCLGTFKTLRTDKNAMETMGILAANFIYEGSNFVNDNIDDFTFRGYQVSIDGKPAWEIQDLERAKEKCHELKEKYDNISLFSFETRKEIPWI